MKKLQEAYCMKCKKKVSAVLVLEEKITSRGTKYLWRGNCPTCQTKMCMIGKKEN